MTLTKKVLTSVAAVSVFFTAGCASICKKDPTKPVSMVKEWDKVFPQSEKVNHRKVTFKNHFGIRLVADLYEPKQYKGLL